MFSDKVRNILFITTLMSCFRVLCFDELPGQHLINELEDNGLISGFKLYGNLVFANACVHQSITEGLKSSSAILSGHVNLKYLGKTDGYGYGLELKARINSGLIKQGTPILSASYLFVEFDKLGLLKFGYTDTAANSFYIGGDSVFAGHSLLRNGYIRSLYNVSAGANVDTRCPFDDGESLKIAWLSPTLSGLSAGVSFTFNTKDSSLFKRVYTRLDGKYNNKNCSIYANSENVLTAGISYEYGAPGGTNIKISASSWIGKSRCNLDNLRINNLKAYHIGALIAYDYFNFSVGYTNNCKSFLLKKSASAPIDSLDTNTNFNIDHPAIGIMKGANAGEVYSLGASYKTDEIACSIGVFRSSTKFSTTEKAKATIMNVAIEYRINKIFSIYSEYTNVISKTCKRAFAYAKTCDFTSRSWNNKANMLVIGTKIDF